MGAEHLTGRPPDPPPDRWVLHVDLDQFIAAVEVRRRPELRGRPVVVGGTGDPTRRGVVSTASYEARAFGVTSGTPLRVALRRCPEAVFLAVDKPAYEAASQEVMAVLRALGPDVGGQVGAVEVLGWDEAFLAVRTSDPHAVARAVQARVRAATGLDCSVGIGENPVQAKTATGFGKPAGVFEITGRTWPEILGERSPDALWGVGSRTARKLAELGITTVAALAAADEAVLADRFGPTIGPWLRRLARGEDRSRVRSEPPAARSRSRETTFQTDLADLDALRSEVAALARQVTADVAGDARPVGRVVVKVRFAPFLTSTHGVRTGEPTRDGDAISRAALAALDLFPLTTPDTGTPRPVRLIGVRAEFTPPSPPPRGDHAICG